MLEKAKIYLGISGNEKDALLNLLIELATDFYETYTRNEANPAIILKMVVEDYNKYGSEGISNLSFGSGNETVLEDYSAGLQKQIRRNKRMGVL